MEAEDARAALGRAAEELPKLYGDPSRYDLLAEMTAPDDLGLYRELAAAHSTGDAAGEVLELGCGTGRVAIALAEAGARVTGIDVVEAMIERAALKAAARGVDVTWALGDMRSFSLDRTFALLLMPYNVLNHLLTHDDLERALAAARAHMDDASRLVIDTFQPSLAFLGGDHRAPRPILRYLDPYIDKEVLLSEENHYDPATQINRVVWRSEVGGVVDARVEETRMRVFFPQELDGYLRGAGLRIEHKWGGYDRSPFDGQSPKQLVVCRRAP